MKKLIINCETKEEKYVDITPEEILEREVLSQQESPFDKPTQSDKIKELEDRLEALEAL